MTPFNGPESPKTEADRPRGERQDINRPLTGHVLERFTELGIADGLLSRVRRELPNEEGFEIPNCTFTAETLPGTRGLEASRMIVVRRNNPPAQVSFEFGEIAGVPELGTMRLNAVQAAFIESLFRSEEAEHRERARETARKNAEAENAEKNERLGQIEASL